MSLSTDVKSELWDIYPKSIHCRIAELAGYISVNGRYESSDRVLIIRTENDDIEKKIRKLVYMTTDIRSDDMISVNEKRHHRKLLINDTEVQDKLFSRLKLRVHDRFLISSSLVTERSCCKSSYLRGVFEAGGSLGSPEKSYQMEISVKSTENADHVKDITDALGISAGMLARGERYIIYSKDGDAISEMLGIIGAALSMMEFENVRILKDIRNSVNREVNCDTANMAKVAGAASRQIEDIKLIEKKAGLDTLPENLREIAEIRIKYPYLSLKELGEQLDRPISKSAINHRLRKLSEYADRLR